MGSSVEPACVCGDKIYSFGYRSGFVVVNTEDERLCVHMSSLFELVSSHVLNH